jgi:hypothetical protein
MKGEKGVRLTINCPADRVLLSDFSLWHYVLNYWYRDLEWHEPDVSERPEEKSVQATMWEITLDQVVACRRFTAR